MSTTKELHQSDKLRNLALRPNLSHHLPFSRPSLHHLASSRTSLTEFKPKTTQTLTLSLANAMKKVQSVRKDDQKELFMESFEMLRSCAVKCFKGKYKKGCIDSLNLIIRASLIIPDVLLLKSSLKLLGFLYIFFNKIKFSIACFERLRDVADEDRDFLSVMFAYKQLGLCFQKVQEYDKSIVCFKSMLQYAWKENNIEFEMQAYDLLGLQYYYLGQLDNAKYYHERMVRGKFESKTSPLRGLSEEQYKKKELQKTDRFVKTVTLEDIDSGTGKDRVIVRDVRDYSKAQEVQDMIAAFLARVHKDL